jgi:hypothetical protein
VLKYAVLVILSSVLLTGCGRLDRWIASQTGSAVSECVGGVEYLQFTSGASVAYTPEGAIKRCK